jgi:V-type H+-transporting ATPase subunit a
MERRLRFFEDQVNKEKREILEEHNQNPEDLGLISLADIYIEPKKLQMDELETKFEELEKELVQMNSNQEMLNRNYNELIELKFVLTKDNTFFSEADFGAEGQDEVDPKTGLLAAADKPEHHKAVKLGFVSGVINRLKFNSFERVLWRSTRGNLFMRHAEIEQKIKDPHTGEMVDKNVFIIFYQGERSQAKIKKICESFGANLYPCPETGRERKDLLTQVNGRLEDLETVLKRSKKHRRQILLDIGHSIKAWKEKVIKEKAIYHTMNMFNYDVGRKCLIAEGWCPKTATESIVTAMRQATETSGALVPSILSVIQSHEEPPTYHKTNDFTAAFQNIVDAYGIAHYREVNPAVFTVITFPFLFAVMFGDIGHGFLLTMYAAYLCLDKRLKGVKLNEMIQTTYDGRYMLLLMGLFSMYTGLLYNECFSVALDFGSNWKVPSGEMYIPGANGTVPTSLPTTMVRIDENRAYEFGVDPAWNGAPNSLNYYNSLKMKLSIILGVTQMIVGICLSAFNGFYFKHYVDVIAEFVPQILFMLCLFGYLVFLCLYKWAQPYSHWIELGIDPPFLLNVMIQMFLSPVNLAKENKLFQQQAVLQPILLLIAVLCIPVMLLAKPLYLREKNKKALQRIPTHEGDGHHGGHGGHGHDEEEFDFSEIFVKQCIHTIEYVLGAISNTASYLRLWALSLAHSELSIVFWENLFMTLYSLGGDAGLVAQIFTAWIGFGAWAGVTFGVLLIMESLSAFLHALRLHWVEFQNKFYKGDGYMFTPFSYERIISGADDE